MGFMMPIMIPLYLGMTFDARYSRPGVDIFDAKYVNNPLVIPYHSVQTNYSVITKESDIAQKLAVSGDIALKIKTGMIKVAGKGSYLKSDRDFEKSITVLTTLKYISVVKAVSSDAIPRENWSKEFSTSVLGTHYVSSVYYGHEMIASAKFVVHDKHDLQKIKGEVETALGSGGSAIELVAEGKLGKLEKKLEGKANLEISFYGTLPLNSIPNTVEGLKELVNSFGNIVNASDMVNGIPLYVDVTPLLAFADYDDWDKFNFVKNKGLMEHFGQFETYLDELKTQRSRLASWARTLPYDIDEEDRHQIARLLYIMTENLLIFLKTLWNLDLTAGPEQFAKAFESYDYDHSGWINIYSRKVSKLIREVDRRAKRNTHATGQVFIHWGNNTCPGRNTAVIYDGFTFSSLEERGIGGTAEYTCSPPAMRQDYPLMPTDYLHSDIAAVRYENLERDYNPFQGPHKDYIHLEGVPCAKCSNPESNAIAMFPASEKCPLTWELLYKGFLMSARAKVGVNSQYICVDDTPTEPYDLKLPVLNTNILALTTVQGGSPLPVDKYIEGSIVKCVVCSMKSDHIL